MGWGGGRGKGHEHTTVMSIENGVGWGGGRVRGMRIEHMGWGSHEHRGMGGVMSIDEWGGGRGRGHEHTTWGRGE